MASEADLKGAIRCAVLGTICAMGNKGTQTGQIYSALMGHGVGLVAFQSLMGSLKADGLVTVSGHVARPTEQGHEVYKGLEALARAVERKRTG